MAGERECMFFCTVRGRVFVCVSVERGQMVYVPLFKVGMCACLSVWMGVYACMCVSIRNVYVFVCGYLSGVRVCLCVY